MLQLCKYFVSVSTILSIQNTQNMQFKIDLDSRIKKPVIFKLFFKSHKQVFQSCFLNERLQILKWNLLHVGKIYFLYHMYFVCFSIAEYISLLKEIKD